MNKIKAISHTIKSHNEDAFGHAGSTAWVMDGALPLNNTHVTDGPSDVVWYVDWWNKYLKNALNNPNREIHDILEDGIKALNHDFSKFVPLDKLDKLDRASSALGLVRFRDNALECYVLGDVEIAVQMKNSDIYLVTDESIKEMDKEVIDLIASTPNRQVVYKGYTEVELKKLQSNRMKMNSDRGYAILEHDVSAVERGIFKRFKAEDVKGAMIMSDGFSALYNNYGRYSLNGLYEAVEQKEMINIIDELRDIEKADIQMLNRLRKHDDATVVFMDGLSS